MTKALRAKGCPGRQASTAALSGSSSPISAKRVALSASPASRNAATATAISSAESASSGCADSAAPQADKTSAAIPRKLRRNVLPTSPPLQSSRNSHPNRRAGEGRNPPLRDLASRKMGPGLRRDDKWGATDFWLSPAPAQPHSARSQPLRSYLLALVQRGFGGRQDRVPGGGRGSAGGVRVTAHVDRVETRLDPLD